MSQHGPELAPMQEQRSTARCGEKGRLCATSGREAQSAEQKGWYERGLRSRDLRPRERRKRSRRYRVVLRQGRDVRRGRYWSSVREPDASRWRWHVRATRSMRSMLTRACSRPCDERPRRCRQRSRRASRRSRGTCGTFGSIGCSHGDSAARLMTSEPRILGGVSSGRVSAFSRGARDTWENTLFGGAYHATGVAGPGAAHRRTPRWSG
jgi:hypothetical protein